MSSREEYSKLINVLSSLDIENENDEIKIRKSLIEKYNKFVEDSTYKTAPIYTPEQIRLYEINKQQELERQKRELQERVDKAKYDAEKRQAEYIKKEYERIYLSSKAIVNSPVSATPQVFAGTGKRKFGLIE